MQTQGLDPSELTKIGRSCKVLFPQDRIDGDFVKRLTLTDVRKSYRSKVKSCHPDLFDQRSYWRDEQFLKLTNSYELLINYLQKGSPEPSEGFHARKTVIAVGGAKGGIGKSIFSTNLGILLSSRGFKTVLVDLDLGGANLHLYLGQRTIPKKNISDFVRERVRSIDDVIMRSKYGPFLIGGNSSEPGVTNIHSSRKMALLEAIRNIEADYVILDLGGDTSDNVLDFFLSADHGVVVTTCDSVSYIGAYHFMKAALYRKLNRLFGDESKFSARKDRNLQAFISRATQSTNEYRVKTIDELMKKAQERNMNTSLIRDALVDFNPHLLVNKVPVEYDPVQVVQRIQDVAIRWLSKRINYVGSISRQDRIEQSVIDLVPVVSRYPRGALAAEIGQIANNLLCRKC